MKALKQLTALLIVIVITGSHSMAYQKENRDVETFTKISLRTSVNVYLTQGSSQKIELSGDNDDFGRLETKVRGGELIINDRDGNNWRSWSGLDIDVYITVKDLDGLSVSGSGDMVSRGKFNCDDLDISVAGSGDLEFEADARDVDISIAGSGSVVLSGSSKMNRVSIAGSGKLDAEDMESNSYRISIAGSGRAKVHATEEITSKITGSGSVYYKGDPSRVNNNSAGSGKIRKI
jgi:hypothetical protein